MNNELNEVSTAFRIYGDNILECEQFVSWLNNTELSGFKLICEKGTLDRPIFIYQDTKIEGNLCAFQLCPYYGGTGSKILWENNPLDGIFNEKLDVIITKLNKDYTESKPILAIEFCDAIQAGNQAWQRFRRAINSAQANIPYLYVLPIIGWERDSGGLKLKNPRYQNAQVCLGHLTLSSNYGTPSMMVYSKTSWTSYAHEKEYTVPAEYELFNGIDNGIKFACYLLRDAYKKNRKVKENLLLMLEELFKDMLIVARTYSKFGNTHFPIHHNHSALKPENIDEASKIYAKYVYKNKRVKGEFALHNINFNDFVKHGVPFFKDAQSKTCSQHFRDNVLDLFNWKDNKSKAYKLRYLQSWGIKIDDDLDDKGLNKIFQINKNKLPLTYKEGKSEGFVVKNRKFLKKILSSAYPKLSKKTLDFICSDSNIDEPIFIVPLYAYKPSGDSRPDRGLLPVIISLFPGLASKKNLLIIVYSKHTPDNWKTLVKNGNNELWNVIKKLSGAMIVDVTKDSIKFLEKK